MEFLENDGPEKPTLSRDGKRRIYLNCREALKREKARTQVPPGHKGDRDVEITRIVERRNKFACCREKVSDRRNG